MTLNSLKFNGIGDSNKTGRSHICGFTDQHNCRMYLAVIRCENGERAGRAEEKSSIRHFADIEPVVPIDITGSEDAFNGGFWGRC